MGFNDGSDFDAVRLEFLEGVKEILSNFDSFRNLVTSIKFPISLEIIDDSCFHDFYALRDVEIPNGVIGSGAFSWCLNLKNITIGNGVTEIGAFAFPGCGGLKTITIPSSVTSMGGRVFSYCDALDSINCEAAQKPEGWDDDWTGDNGDKVVWGYVASYQVLFDTVGGNTVEKQVIIKNGTVTEPTAPTKAGYTFKGWYNSEEAYDFNTPVTDNLTLTAHWEAIPEPEPTEPENQEQNNETIPTEQESTEIKNGAVVAAVAGTSGVACVTAIGTIVGVVLKKRRK